MAKVIGKLSALQLALSELTPQGLNEGEFTLVDFVDEARQAGKHIPRPTASNTLGRLVASGKLAVRKALVNGRLTNAYSHPK